SVLYVMCTGRPPFRAANTMAVLKRVCDDTPRPIPQVIPEVPRWLCDLIGRLHAKDPAARFRSADEVAELLAKGAADPPAAAPPRARRPVLAAAALAVAVLLGLGVYAATRPRANPDSVATGGGPGGPAPPPPGTAPPP